MLTIPARRVKPGMTIKTEATADTPPVTLTVADGGWCDADYAEPADPEHPTHVYLGEAGPDGAEVLLPVNARVTVIPSANGDSRDGFCDDCAHAPGEHPVAAVIAYCDTKHDHEVTLITEGTVAYAYGPHTDVEGVSLAASPLATETPRGGLILSATCGQPVRYGTWSSPDDAEPCEGEVRWVIEADDWMSATPEQRDLLAQHQARIEDL